MPPKLLKYEYDSFLLGKKVKILPLSWYCSPSHSPLKIISLPTAQSAISSVPKKYCFTISGLISASQTFSIGAFTGGMVLKDQGLSNQLIGCAIGVVAIFLPSALLVLFFFPVWHNLKKYAVIFRSLEGIRASVVGIMAGAVVYLLNDHILPDLWVQNWTILWDMAIVLATFLVLQLNKVPAPFIVISCLILGAIA